jgi:hypothetical protein
MQMKIRRVTMTHHSQASFGSWGSFPHLVPFSPMVSASSLKVAVSYSDRHLVEAFFRAVREVEKPGMTRIFIRSGPTEQPIMSRDDNSGMSTRYPSDTRPDGYGNDFLPTGGTRTRPESRRVRDGYFFPPVGNLTGTRYFTTAIVLCCEQVKMYSFCYINYDLF